jgi:hypothetical protein
MRLSPKKATPSSIVAEEDTPTIMVAGRSVKIDTAGNFLISSDFACSQFCQRQTLILSI